MPTDTPPSPTPRRRKRTRPPIDYSVPSPCVAVCRVDTNDVCIGCHRTIDEIRDWMILSREDKLAVLEKVAQRRLSASSDDGDNESSGPTQDSGGQEPAP